MARTEKRRKYVEEALATSSVDYMRWDDGVLDTGTARTMRLMLDHFNLSTYERTSDKLTFLREESGLEVIAVSSIRQSLMEAIGWCYELLRGGVPPDEIRARIKVGDGETLVTKPGVHVLNGHVGKGQ